MRVHMSFLSVEQKKNLTDKIFKIRGYFLIAIKIHTLVFSVQELTGSLLSAPKAHNNV